MDLSLKGTLRTTYLATGFVAGSAAAALAGDIDLSGFGQDVAKTNPGPAAEGSCPDVVVVDIPFCTDECGQFLKTERREAVAEAFAKADLNNDGSVLAYITAYASRVATTEHNQGLTDERAGLATRLAVAEGARIAYTASYGETFASGTEVADFAEDRSARIFFTESADYMVQTADGVIQPIVGAEVIGYTAPACDGHLRNGPPVN